MGTAVEYRLANEDDLAELATMRWEFRMEEAGSLQQHAPGSFHEACVDFLHRELVSGRWVYWIAAANGQIVSHIFVQIMRKVPKPNRLVDADGYMTNVYTRPAYRNQGIGSILLQHVIEWARAADLGSIYVWPSERSRRYYERGGFQPDNEVMGLELRPYVL